MTRVHNARSLYPQTKIYKLFLKKRVSLISQRGFGSGTTSALWRILARRATNCPKRKKSLDLRLKTFDLLCSGSRTRTYDLRVMSDAKTELMCPKTANMAFKGTFSNHINTPNTILNQPLYDHCMTKTCSFI
jgi:hypothetical protein